MSDIQKAMALLISSFTKYASKEGDKDTLNKEELKELLQNEFGEMLCVSVLSPQSISVLHTKQKPFIQCPTVL